jgi:hypothetical protein
MRYLVAGLLLPLTATLMLRIPPRPAYVGAERCRLCHRAVYTTWSRTPHFRATEAVAAEPDHGDCLRCHATGPEALPGVQCEACHGPGSRYWRPEVMMDPQKAKEAGLIDPDESVCRNCHGSNLPEHSASFTMPTDAEKRLVIH